MDQESFNKLLREKLPCVWEGLHVQVVEVAEDHVTVQIPMAGNGNDKGTMFAGASYSALVVAGWCLVMNQAFASGFNKPWAAIVDAHCHYAKPVVADALATATFAEPPVLVPGARNWPKVQVQIGEQVAFEGVYAVGEQRE
jgi:thioesterase domain-containing protein